MTNANRQLWNKQQKKLQNILLRSSEYQHVIELCLSQHAMVHTAAVSEAGLWSFEDELWQEMRQADFIRIPKGGEYSIAWHIWHTTRIEDITMNTLAAGETQILDRGSWLEKIKSSVRDTGNAMTKEEVENFSCVIDMEQLRAYRLAVGRKTREIIKNLQPEGLLKGVEPARLQQVVEQGDVVEAAKWLIDYWGKRKNSGLITMPATRHNFVHLNEASRIKVSLARESSIKVLNLKELLGER